MRFRGPSVLRKGDGRGTGAVFSPRGKRRLAFGGNGRNAWIKLVPALRWPFRPCPGVHRIGPSSRTGAGNRRTKLVVVENHWQKRGKHEEQSEREEAEKNGEARKGSAAGLEGGSEDVR